VVPSHDHLRRAVAGLTLALVVLVAVLSAATHASRPTFEGLGVALALAFATVGYVVARQQPRNPIGWIFLSLALMTLTDYVVRLYLILDYRQHGGDLPLGAAGVIWRVGVSLTPLIVGLAAILLFPDGRLSRRWRWVLRAYVVVGAAFVVSQIVGAAIVGVPGHVAIDATGQVTNDYGGAVASAGWIGGPLLLGFWISFVVRQVLAWRSAAGVPRAQLKWLMASSATCLASCVLLLVVGQGTSTVSRVLGSVAIVGIASLPIAMGVAILRYRLYEIDRLISRTLAYALLTGLLIGVFGGLVLLTTRVLPFSSPVAVAASTLAAAALFNPLRSRVQRLVDRRFNRARYDREALVAVFGARLRDAVDSETVLAELAGAASRSVEPAHVSIWLRS
jgi:hypothetical protein